jgi:hypothetical protein
VTGVRLDLGKIGGPGRSRQTLKAPNRQREYWYGTYSTEHDLFVCIDLPPRVMMMRVLYMYGVERPGMKFITER